jgi:hypothetical protein
MQCSPSFCWTVRLPCTYIKWVWWHSVRKTTSKFVELVCKFWYLLIETSWVNWETLPLYWALISRVLWKESREISFIQKILELEMLESLLRKRCFMLLYAWPPV